MKLNDLANNEGAHRRFIFGYHYLIPLLNS